MGLALLQYLGGVSGALTMLGSVAGTAALALPPLILALAALGTALAIWHNWDKVKAKIDADLLAIDQTSAYYWRQIKGTWNLGMSGIHDTVAGWMGKIKALFHIDAAPSRAGGPPDAGIRAPKPGEIGPQSRLESGKNYSSYYMRSGDNRPIQVHTQIKLNERVLAEAVTQHQTNEINRATGSGYFDSTLTAPHPALG
jgi:hypothetical protein